MRKKRHPPTPRPAAPLSAGAATRPSLPAKEKPGRRTVAERVAALSRLAGWRLWAANLATAVIVPLFLLAAADGGLRLFGYGYPTSFCLWQRSPSAQAAPVYVENDQFLWQFYSPKTNLRPNPFAVAAAKTPQSFRIVILGESAAAGTPEPAFNFGRILDRMLRQQFPQLRLDVINAAMRGINSHILLPVATDCCAKLKPDLLIVYAGNNETVGLYAPGPRSGRLLSHLRLLRALQWVRATRLGQLLDPLLARLAREGVPVDQQDDQFFQQRRVAADDPRRSAVYDNFRANLADVCRAARRAGAALVLMTVPVNLKDFPPLGSLHRPGLSDPDLLRWQAAFDAGIEAEAAARPADAITNYQAAAALDDHHAELHFRLARCWFALGQFPQARHHFTLACDWDALQFRADSRLNDIIRQTAARFQSPATWLLDTDRVFAESDPEERLIPGGRFFRDHVHPNFDGDYLLARTLFPAVCEALNAPRPPPGPLAVQTNAHPAASSLPVLSRDECAARLAFTPANDCQLANDMLKATSFPPFTGQLDHARRQQAAEQKLRERIATLTARDLETTAETCLAAMRQFPDDWRLPYCFARLRFLARDYPGAILQFQAAQHLLPHWPPIQIGLSAALAAAGRADEALRLLRGLQARYPHIEEIKVGIAAIQAQGHQ